MLQLTSIHFVNGLMMSQINKIKLVGVSLTRGKGCQGLKGGNLGLKEGQQAIL